MPKGRSGYCPCEVIEEVVTIELRLEVCHSWQSSCAV